MNHSNCPHQPADGSRPCVLPYGTHRIHGRTLDGQRFRPASADQNWALRLAELVANTEAGQARHMCCARPGLDAECTPYLDVHRSLETCAPELWAKILRFAADNRLLVSPGLDLGPAHEEVRPNPGVLD